MIDQSLERVYQEDPKGLHTDIDSRYHHETLRVGGTIRRITNPKGGGKECQEERLTTLRVEGRNVRGKINHP